MNETPRIRRPSEARRWLPLTASAGLIVAISILAYAVSDSGGSRSVRDAGSRQAVERALAAQPHEEDSLPTLRLVATESVSEQLFGAGRDRAADRSYHAAVFVDEHRESYEAGVRLRGASDPPRRSAKPSLEVRLRKADVRHGRRDILLRGPEDTLAVKGWLPAQIGRELGLMTDAPDHVRLFVNGESYGVYLRTMRAAEPLALAFGRMPGTFFLGDGSARTWEGVDRWDLVGEDDGAPRERFARFLALLAEMRDWPRRTPAHFAELWERLDFEAYAKWSALMVVVGGDHDAGRDHRYFLSPSHGPLEPLVSNPRAFAVRAKPDRSPDRAGDPVAVAALGDPRWHHRRNQILWDLVNGASSPARLRATIDTAVGRLRSDLLAGVDASGAQRAIETEREALQRYIIARAEFLRRHLASVSVSVTPLPGVGDACEVTVVGNVGVRVERRDGVAVQATTWPGTPNLLYPSLSGPPPVQGSPSPRVVDCQPSAARYRVAAAPAQLRFRNAVTDEAIDVTLALPASDLPALTFTPQRLAAPPRSDVVLGPGEVVLDADVHTAPGQRLVIRPGTRLRLRKGVGIYARGPTLAVGREDAPIVIERRGAKPWAAFGVHGVATRGSRFAHLRVHGGSVGTDRTTDFRGMFSVYGCPDVELRDCHFGRNHVGDDAVNLVRSTVVVEACQWVGARADALDLEMCEGSVRNCSFIDSGNDGVDLMTSRVIVRGCRVERSGDKGISVGENSHVVVRDCEIVSCELGFECKDASRLLVRDCLLRRNDRGMHSYQKRWVYGRGGTTAFLDCRFERTKIADLSVEKRSSVLVAGKTVVGVIEQGADRVSEVSSLGEEWRDLLDRQ